MAMPSLPTYVRIGQADFEEAIDYGLKRTDTDGGLPKQRPTRSTPIVTRTCSLLIDGQANRDAFDIWFGQTLAGGSAWFTLPLRGKPVRARFTEKLRWKPQGRPDLWSTPATLETIG